MQYGLCAGMSETCCITALCVLVLVHGEEDEEATRTSPQHNYILYAEEKDNAHDYDLCALRLEDVDSTGPSLSSSPLRFVSGHKRRISNLRSMTKKDGKSNVVSSSLDGCIFIYGVEVSTNESKEFILKQTRKFDCHKDSVLAMEIISVPDHLSGHWVISGGRDCTLMVWDSVECEERVIFTAQHRNASWITSFAVASSKISAEENHDVKDQEWNMEPIQESTASLQQSHSPNFDYSDGDGDEFDSKSNSLDMRYTKVHLNLPWIHPPSLAEEKGGEIMRVDTDNVHYRKTDYLRALPIIASGDEAGRISIWNIGFSISIIKAHSNPVRSLSFVLMENRDHQLVSGCTGGVLAISNPISGQILHKIYSQEGIECLIPVVYPEFRNAALVYVSCSNCSLKVFDCKLGRFLSIIVGGELGPHTHWPGTKYFILLRNHMQQALYSTEEEDSKVPKPMDSMTLASKSTSGLDGGSSTTTTDTLDSSVVSGKLLMYPENDHKETIEDEYCGSQYNLIITGSRPDIGLQSFDINSVISYWLA